MPPYIGCKLSLISTSDVRYQGTLYTIDPQESTIALQNVQNMGTENRRSDKVEASSTIYEYIVFRGDNIKTLKLIDDDSDSVLINDPAILEVKQSGFLDPDKQQSTMRKQRIKKAKAKAKPVTSWKGNRGGRNWFGGRGGSRYPQRGNSRSRRGRGGTLNGRRNRVTSNGGYRQGYPKNYGYIDKNWTDGPDYNPQYIGNNGRNVSKNKRRNGRSRKSQERVRDNNPSLDIPGTGMFLERQANDKNDIDWISDMEFDFQGNLARFDMSSLRNTLADQSQDKNSDGTIEPTFESLSRDLISEHKDDTSKDISKWEVKSAYKKDLFFDTLTKDQDVTSRKTGPEMRELNAETFGKIGSTYRCRTR